LQRFTPRRQKSGWSKRNTLHAGRLIKEGRMKPAGFRAIEEAKADGRWERAYDSPSNAKVPADFLKLLSKNPKARKFFESLDKTNLYSISYRLQTAKTPQTRETRLKRILEILAKGKKFH
ncbi:MAG TPA: YdeI/OmpD-associated family protein, partial [Candidatus Bilamarchaeum sp.]|nr:YdeI/OmpD-associated family protein [Candidatus Bilamarchaeum sp.]